MRAKSLRGCVGKRHRALTLPSQRIGLQGFSDLLCFDTASNAPKLHIQAMCQRPPSTVQIYTLEPADRSSQARDYTSTLLPTAANSVRGQPLLPLVRHSDGSLSSSSSNQASSGRQGWIRGRDPFWVHHGLLHPKAFSLLLLASPCKSLLLASPRFSLQKHPAHLAHS
jgi:hypothetical protein